MTKLKTLTGDVATLAKRPCRTWSGWVMYSWDMGFTCYLFDEKPPRDDFAYSLDGGTLADPEVLRECGIDLAYDLMDDAGREFYYGSDSDGHGNHKPLPIELTLPYGLLSSLVGNLTEPQGKI
jgi:hypothetical protein